MSHPTIEPARWIGLRGRANTRLGRSSSATDVRASATDALAVLHALASSPATAADALALLHELQVHQVELDLQAEELRESRAVLEAALCRQIDLYEHLPAGCVTVDRRLLVLQINRIGAGMFGVEQDEACGRPLESLLAADSGRSLQQIASRVAQGAARASATLELPRDGAQARPVTVTVGADPGGPGFLVVLTPFAEGRESPAAST